VRNTCVSLVLLFWFKPFCKLNCVNKFKS